MVLMIILKVDVSVLPEQENKLSKYKIYPHLKKKKKVRSATVRLGDTYMTKKNGQSWIIKIILI